MPTVAQRYEDAVPLERLSPHPENVNHGDEALIGASIADNGFFGAVLVQASSGSIIAGEHRWRSAGAQGEETVPVLWLDVDDDRASRMRLVDNRAARAGHDDAARLAELLSGLAQSDDGLAGTGYDDDGLTELLASLEEPEPEPPPPPPGPSLADRFLVPPFTVLDARQGYWQDRKRSWLSLGIRSEEGRPTNLLKMSEQAATGYGRSSSGAYGAQATTNADGSLSYETGVGLTSIFDPVLCEIAYRWFCPPGGSVLDPFAGGSVRGVVAARLGLSYVGVELRPEQIAANEEQAAQLCPGSDVRWVEGDARELDAALPEQSFDLLFTCPPYFDLEQYSDDPRDLSNLGEGFADAYRSCIRQACARLPDDRFAVMVVGNARSKSGELRDLGALTVEAFAGQGLAFYNDAILVTPAATLALRAARNFATRKLGRSHQQVLVFLKGDPQRAVEACGPVEVADPAELFGELADPAA